MKNNIWFIICCILFFFTGYHLNNAAISFPRYKVAVVDVAKIMEQYPEVKALKVSQDKQMKDLNNLIAKAQKEIVNEPDKNKAMQMESNYRKEIDNKRNAIDDEYSKKVNEITENIKTLITKEAKKSDYNLVLPTGMVITGGEDITQNIIKNVEAK